MTVAPFAFDAVFRIEPGAEDDPRKEIPASEVAAREDTAFRNGEASALAREQAAQTAALTAISQAVAALLGAVSDEAARYRRFASQIALAAAEKASGRLVSLHGRALVEEALNECLSIVPDTPEIEARLSPDIAQRYGEEIEAAAREAGYAGRVLVTPDASVADADCRFAWPGGALERRRKEILEKIAAVIDRHLTATEEEVQFDLFSAEK